MDTDLKLSKILSQVQKLNKFEQAVLVKKIAGMIGESKSVKMRTKLSGLAGLGADVWHGVDIDKYVDEERQW